MRVAIVDDERCELHVQTPDHQESPDRVRAIRNKLFTLNLTKLTPIEPTEEDLALVHSKRYIKKVIRSCTNYGSAIIDDQDVRVTGEGSLTAAKVAVGGVLAAVNEVIAGKNNIKRVFCNIRPPGHHASETQASGFCIFNNVAIGAKKSLSYNGINKVLIFDWDLHHGNGTQQIFEKSDNVMFCSFHRAKPFYPNTGSSEEKGKYGNIHNYPQSPYTNNTTNTNTTYMNEFEQFMEKAYEFNPDIVFISCGFDGHKDDVYHALGLDNSHYRAMTKALCKLADKCCEGRLISVLEGGYDPDVIADCALAHVKELC